MVDLNTLADAVTGTLSPNPTQRRQAESFLTQNASTSGFSILLLQLIASESVPSHVRQAAAVFMKNNTINMYASDDWQDTPSTDRDRVKSSIVDIMLSVPVPIRRQLSNALATIAENEYPKLWPELVPSLCDKLGVVISAAQNAQPGSPVITQIDWNSMQGILETLHAIFDRYPERMRTNDLYSEINYSLKHTSKHVQVLMALLAKVINEDIASKDPKLIEASLACTALVCKIFYCLSWQDIPEYFEDHLPEYMSELRKLLVFESAAIDEMVPDEPGKLDDVHAAVMEITNLYATKFDEEFRPFLPQFIQDSWALLMRRGSSVKYDLVVTTGIKFLSSVSRSPDAHLFEAPNVLSEVCNRIVIPNIGLREEDMELFEDDPLQYVRRDLEGSDTGTRRRGAVELVKGLCMKYEKQVTEIFSSYVQGMLSPQVDWRKRDAAIYLVIALGWKSGTATHGATQTSSLINIGEFFRNFILPELRTAGKNASQLSSPIFTADLIKFVISFRNQTSKEGCAEVIVLCANLLSAQEAVVRTYAAACMERILTVKEKPTPGAQNGVATATRNLPYRFSKEEIAPLLSNLLPAVINTLKANDRPDEYLMRLVLRLCTTSRDRMGSFVESLLPTLVEIFVAATANPANPLFNHYLFETIAALIRFNATPSNVGSFDSALLDPLYNVLINDVTEFAPYVFQVMSQMMYVHTGELPTQYSNLMSPILNPTMWERRGYIPGMVQYIETYMQKCKDNVVANNQMSPILGVFQKLIASKASDHHGLRLITTMFETYDMGVMSLFVSDIFRALMFRLSKAKTVKYVKNLLCCLSTFLLRYGVDAMKSAFDSVDASVFGALLRQVWMPEVVTLRNAGERRLCAVALTQMACGSELCQNEPFAEMWPGLIMTNVALAEGIVMDQNDEGEESEDEEDLAIHMGSVETYSTAHSQLKWGLANGSRVSPLVVEMDPRVVLAAKLTEFLGKHSNFNAVFQEKVEPRAREAIVSYAKAK